MLQPGCLVSLKIGHQIQIQIHPLCLGEQAERNDVIHAGGSDRPPASIANMPRQSLRALKGLLHGMWDSFKDPAESLSTPTHYSHTPLPLPLAPPVVPLPQIVCLGSSHMSTDSGGSGLGLLSQISTDSGSMGDTGDASQPGHGTEMGSDATESLHSSLYDLPPAWADDLYGTAQAMQAMPYQPMQAMPGPAMQAMPGPAMHAMPGPAMQAVPSPAMQAMPGAAAPEPYGASPMGPPRPPQLFPGGGPVSGAPQRPSTDPAHPSPVLLSVSPCHSTPVSPNGSSASAHSDRMASLVSTDSCPDICCADHVPGPLPGDPSAAAAQVDSGLSPEPELVRPQAEAVEPGDASLLDAAAGAAAEPPAEPPVEPPAHDDSVPALTLAKPSSPVPEGPLPVLERGGAPLRIFVSEEDPGPAHGLVLASTAPPEDTGEPNGSEVPAQALEPGVVHRPPEVSMPSAGSSPDQKVHHLSPPFNDEEVCAQALPVAPAAALAQALNPSPVEEPTVKIRTRTHAPISVSKIRTPHPARS